MGPDAVGRVTLPGIYHIIHFDARYSTSRVGTDRKARVEQSTRAACGQIVVKDRDGFSWQAIVSKCLRCRRRACAGTPLTSRTSLKRHPGRSPDGCDAKTTENSTTRGLLPSSQWKRVAGDATHERFESSLVEDFLVYGLGVKSRAKELLVEGVRRMRRPPPGPAPKTGRLPRIQSTSPDALFSTS